MRSNVFLGLASTVAFALVVCNGCSSSNDPSATVRDGAGTSSGAASSGGGATSSSGGATSSSGSSSSSSSSGGTPPPLTTAPPKDAPATICDNASVLDGPTTAPAGAVTVATSDKLDEVVDAHPAGTTFYLAAGTHKLGTGEYDQVQPKDGDVFIGAPGAILDGGKVNRYAFTTKAKNVAIRHLTIQNFVSPMNEGVVNHDAGDSWTIELNTIQANGGAGVFLGNNSITRSNCLRNNGQYGFSAYADEGVKNVTLDHNEISGNNTDDWETKEPGCGCTGAGKFWATTNAVITNNYIHDNKSVGLWADTNNVGFDIEGNYISGNYGPGFMYEISYNARVINNTFVRNALIDGPTNPGFPTGAIYLSEAGGDARAGGSFSTIEIANNVFTDNWSGVVLWENADRYCNSPANTSSDECTLGGAATLTKCVAGTIEKEPYLSDCRWKTQNVTVHDNQFSVTPSNIPGCTTDASCGLQGLFSNFGTYPNWSPYKDAVVEDAIISKQNNVFANNTYTGPWMFMIHDQDNVISFAKWQAAPYNQDKGSTTK